MHASLGYVRARESRPRDHIENIAVRSGDIVGVGHRNQQYPDFLWCASESGRQGWIAESYIEMISPTEGKVLRDYDASQLTVVKGELLQRLDAVGAFVLCRNANGAEGWVPSAILEEAAES